MGKSQSFISVISRFRHRKSTLTAIVYAIAYIRQSPWQKRSQTGEMLIRYGWVSVTIKSQAKAQHLYSALHGIQTTLKRSGMDHTVQ